MHITAMKVIRPGMYEYEVVAEMNRVAESNNCELSFADCYNQRVRLCTIIIMAIE